jgi:hypothetical protein
LPPHRNDSTMIEEEQEEKIEEKEVDLWVCIQRKGSKL